MSDLVVRFPVTVLWCVTCDEPCDMDNGHGMHLLEIRQVDVAIF
jgi:hypothetical protein